jgi:hypothetical protein
VKQTVRSFAKRATAPLLGALDRRFRELAERLERHTSNLAADQRRRLEQLDERVALDVRVVDEHLLAIQRAARRIDATATLPPELAAVIQAALSGDGAGVVVAGAGQPLVAVPEGFEVARRLAFRAGEDGVWEPVTPGEDPDTVRVLQLRRRP